MSGAIVFAAISEGGWRPGIGDPTFLGWLTVAAYFAAMGACGRVWLLDRRAARRGEPASPTLWLVLAVLLGILGVNKQLDLQSLLTEIGRTMARRQDWYARRREVQAAFIIGVGVAAILVLAALSWLARKQPRRCLTALAGVVLLFAFVTIRAASFHHFDAFLRSQFAGVKWNAILELGGIGVVALGAATAMRRERGRSSERDEAMGPKKYWIPGAGPAPPGRSSPRK